MNYHEILNTIIFYRIKLTKLTAYSAVLIFLFLFLVYPITYKSTVSILPPEKTTPLGLGNLMTGLELTNLLGAAPFGANPQLYLEILKSRTAAEYVADKLNLVNYYGCENSAEAVKKLMDDVDAEVTKEGIIKLSVPVKTPVLSAFSSIKDSIRNLAAAVSNAYAEALDEINKIKLSTKAKKARIYIEDQIIVTKQKLDSIESRLLNFQKENKTISLPEQVKAAIESAAKLKAEIISTEVELGLAETNLQEDNKTLIALKEKLQELKHQYDKMEKGSEDFLLAFKDVPQLGIQLADLLREVKIQNEVYLLLQQQYYKEKIQENRDIPTIEILDPAVPPLKAAGPRIVVSTILGSIFVFVLVSAILLWSEKKIKSELRGE